MANVNPQKHKKVIQEEPNSREIPERFITEQHVSLPRLKELMLQERPWDPMVKYIRKTNYMIPPYPTPVQFWVSDVAHVTDESGFKGIMESEAFRSLENISQNVRFPFSWWDLKINKEEIISAEEHYTKNNLSNQAQELNEQKPFLEKFTTSPLFQLEKSRFGNYRFTFPLADLMDWYKEQNCGGEEPVLKVFKTITYRQEIVYTVLIHSPENDKCFKEYPLLQESEWVHYQDGKIIWKAQAICEKHWYEFISGEVRRLNTHEFFVWDQVSLVFHLPRDTTLQIPRERLIEALEACRLDNIDLSRYQGPKTEEERFMDAKMKVSESKRELGEEKEEREEKEKDEEVEEKEKESKNADNIKMEVDP